MTEYERIDPDPNDRAPSQSAYPSYRLRAEVSGDFDVAEDGTISIPILGQFTAAGKTAGQLRDAIAPVFESTIGHVGLITIAIAEHQPIYVDGLVKNAGAYKYTPGLTAFHAVSLAGGYEDIKLESHQVLLSTLEEARNGEEAKETLQRLLAREAVLHAELDSSAPSAPALLDLVGETRAKELIAEQVAERKIVADTNAVEQQRQAQLIDSAKEVLDSRASQIGMIDAAIEQRGARLKNLKTMMSKGLANEFAYETAQAEYLDTLARKQDVVAGIQQSQSQLNDAQTALAKLKLDARFALQHEMSDLELQIALQSIVYRSHMATASIVTGDPNVSPGAPPLTYELVRRTGGSVASYQVDGSCLLQPGDLVRIHVGGASRSEEVRSDQPAPEERATGAAGLDPGKVKPRLMDFPPPRLGSALPMSLQ